MARKFGICGTWALISITAIALGGCGLMHTATYSEPYVNHAVSKIPILFSGTALVVTTPEADAARMSKHASSFQGGALSINFESGRFCRDTAMAVFDRAFQGRAAHYSARPDIVPANSIVIAPSLKDFEWRIRGDGGNGAVDMQVGLVMEVAQDKAAPIQQQCDSGMMSEEVKWQGPTDDKSLDVFSATVGRAFIMAYEKCLKAMEAYLPRAKNQQLSHGPAPVPEVARTP